MDRAGLFIDANLLVLLVVGSTGRDLISKHKRLRGAYTAEDYDILVDLISPVDRVFVTPNTLTEVSNLLGHHAEPERSQLFDKLRTLIQESEEIVIASEDASSNRKFRRLGLADAALLELITTKSPLLTADLDLYLAALAKGHEAAVNFAHYRKL
ncbi:MAG: PIN domain-containing protein [Bryobacterales bacterium]|nr:PIN domain-containing protein [Bryobacterales bacterium]